MFFPGSWSNCAANKIYWQANVAAATESLRVDFAGIKKLSGIVMQAGDAANWATYYTLQYSYDLVEWMDYKFNLTTLTLPGPTTPFPASVTYTFPNNLYTRAL